MFQGLKHMSHVVEYISHGVGYNFVRDRNYVNTHTETLVVIIKRYWQISVVSGKSGIFA